MMKKLFLCLLASGIATSYAQTPREVQRGMITKITATWCNPCGSWGWSLANDMIAAKSSEAFFVGVYASNLPNWDNLDFYNSTAVAWATNSGMSGYPSFAANAVDKSAQNTVNGGVNTAGVKSDVFTAIDAFAAAPVVASSGYWFTKNGTVITTHIKTKFWQATTGDYYVAAYLVEDGALHSQNGQTATSGKTEHHNVLRSTMGSNTGTPIWGSLIASGSINAGSEYETSYTVDIASEPSWDVSKIKVITVIWKKEGTKFQYVNGNDNSESPTTAVAKVEGMTSLSVYPNPATSNATVTVQLQDASDVDIRLMDVSGRVVYSDNVHFKSGMNAYDLQTSGFASGMYVLSMTSPKGTVTQRLSVTR